MKNSLKRLKHEYVDVVFCHRPESETPLLETCRAMNYLIEEGYAFYWGTSMWKADTIYKAISLCELHNLIKPSVEQPHYNMLFRDHFEKELSHLFEETGYGSTIYSPLCRGLLTGKYNSGEVPDDTRLKNAPRYFRAYFSEGKREKTIKKL